MSATKEGLLTETELLLAMAFEPRDRLTLAGVELITHDLRRLVEIGWLLEHPRTAQAIPSLRMLQTLLAEGSPYSSAQRLRQMRTLYEESYRASLRPDTRYVLSRVVRSTPAPLVRSLSLGSLQIVVDLTPLMIGGGILGVIAGLDRGVIVVGKVLALIERFWNIRLRLKSEAKYLRDHIGESSPETTQSSPLDQLGGVLRDAAVAEPQIPDVRPQLETVSGAVGADWDELADDEAIEGE